MFTFLPVLWPGAQTDVGIKAGINAEATASFSAQTSVTVKSKMEATTVMKKYITGLLVGSMLLWGLVTFLQRRSGC